MKSFSDPHPAPPAADALRDWARANRARFDPLEPPAELWATIALELPTAPDALRSWTTQHRTVFDLAEPHPDLWTAIDRQLASVAESNLASVPHLTASRAGGGPRPATRPAWWQAAAAAVVVFGLGYGLRVGTETAPAATVAAAEEQPRPADFDSPDDATLHVAAPRHGFRNQEPDPAVQAAVLASNVQAAPDLTAASPERRTSARTSLAPEITRLEARYAALVARQRASARHRFVPTHALADEWDREMAVLDSAYAALRQELPRNRRTDDVVAAMNRNLHLRLKLMQQQMMALDAVQEMRQRAAGRIVPRRPPSVNPDDNGVNLEDAASGGGTLVPPAPPAPEPVPGLGIRVAPRPRLAV
ncbi:MAG: hypothetical protein H7330_08385 [Hymenobacteraceae bacterium]|nr:hypothetical protein [Hymenobacteraceae bacterium]